MNGERGRDLHILNLCFVPLNKCGLIRKRKRVLGVQNLVL